MALKKLQEDMLHFIEESRNKLVSGEDINLQGLQTQVSDFCQAISKLPAEDMRAWEQSLQQLHQRIGELGELLVSQREAVIAALGAVETQKQAHRAYKVAAHTKPVTEEN